MSQLVSVKEGREGEFSISGGTRVFAVGLQQKLPVWDPEHADASFRKPAEKKRSRYGFRDLFYFSCLKVFAKIIYSRIGFVRIEQENSGRTPVQSGKEKDRMEPEEPSVVEETTQKAIETIGHGRFREFFQYIWDNYQYDLMHFGKVIVLSLLIVLLAKVCIRMVHALMARAPKNLRILDLAAKKVLDKAVSYGIAFLAILIILDLLGVNTASLITVLGAAGLAIGLAFKDTLSNIAAGVILLFLRPYTIGDYVDCGSVSGTVTEMGFFTTTLTTMEGLYLSVPNAAIWGTPIKNYTRNGTRRMDITVGISYSDSLEQGVAILKELVEKNDKVLKDPAPQVLVMELADSSVNLQIRVWATVEHYWDLYFQLKYQLKGALESRGLNIPFPQRVITFANPLSEQECPPENVIGGQKEK